MSRDPCPPGTSWGGRRRGRVARDAVADGSSPSRSPNPIRVPLRAAEPVIRPTGLTPLTGPPVGLTRQPTGPQARTQSPDIGRPDPGHAAGLTAPTYWSAPEPHAP